MSFETLNYDVQDGVALMTLNRPDMRNAVNSVMSRELPRMWRQFEEDDSAVVAVITGAGDKAFCAGGDIQALYHSISENHDAGEVVNDPTPPSGVTLAFANTVGFTVIDCDRNPNASYPETLSVTIDVMGTLVLTGKKK